MNERVHVTCEIADELGAALALGALSDAERSAVLDHLGSCDRPHDEVRSLLGVGAVLAAALDPVDPSPSLRSRLMASVAATAQEHAVLPPTSAAAPAGASPTQRRWRPLAWLSPAAARGLAAAALAVIVVLGAWNVTLQAQLGDADRVTRALAEARAIIPVTGEAGHGLLLDTPDGPRFLASGLEPAPAGSLYELWLIGSDGVPVDVGVVTDTGGVALVPVEDQLAGYETFAVTVESSRVEAPTSAPILVAALGEPGGS